MVLRHPSPPEDPMAERPKTAPRLRRSQSYMHRRASSGPPTRASNTESRRPMEGEGNFPPCKALKSHKTRKLLSRTPRQDSPPLRDPRHRRRLDEVARDRSSFAICSNSQCRRPMGEEENFPPCKALKSLKTRKSLPCRPRRDSHGRRQCRTMDAPRLGLATGLCRRVAGSAFLHDSTCIPDHRIIGLVHHNAL